MFFFSFSKWFLIKLYNKQKTKEEQKKKKEEKKNADDPNKPKKPASSYILFR